MAKRLDLDLIQAVAEILEGIEPPARLTALKKLVLNNGGIWEVPGDCACDFAPALLSVHLFGIYAMSETIEDLPENWIKAARNILEGATQNPPEAA